MDTSFKIPGISKPVTANQPIYNGSHFTWGEATKNGSRLPIATYFETGWINAEIISGNIIKIARELDLIRSQFGDRPIKVTSWLRPPAANKIVGGVSNSQHLLGWAVDIQIAGYDPHEVAKALDRHWPGGLGDSATFTHLDMRNLIGRGRVRWNYGNA
jgi:Peptidase M15